MSTSSSGHRDLRLAPRGHGALWRPRGTAGCRRREPAGSPVHCTSDRRRAHGARRHCRVRSRRVARPVDRSPRNAGVGDRCGDALATSRGATNFADVVGAVVGGIGSGVGAVRDRQAWWGRQSWWRRWLGLAACLAAPMVVWPLLMLADGIGSDFFSSAPPNQLLSRILPTIDGISDHLVVLPIAAVVAVFGMMAAGRRQRRLHLASPGWLWLVVLVYAALLAGTYVIGTMPIQWWLPARRCPQLRRTASRWALSRSVWERREVSEIVPRATILEVVGSRAARGRSRPGCRLPTRCRCRTRSVASLGAAP